MKNKILLILTVFISSQVFTQNISVNFLIGYRKNTPIFSGYKHEKIYSFDNDFKVFSNGIKNYEARFCNDSVILYSSISKDNNEIIMYKNGDLKKLVLSHNPERIISNLNGDTLYYSSGENEIEKIYVYIVKDKKIIRGISVDYESFWIFNNHFYYTLVNDVAERTLFVTNSVFEKGILLKKNAIKFYDNISYDGKYIIGFYRKGSIDYCNVVNLKTNEIKTDVIPSSAYFSFFYNNETYFYKPGNSECIKSKIQLE